MITKITNRIPGISQGRSLATVIIATWDEAMASGECVAQALTIGVNDYVRKQFFPE
jgi:CheY-like chemotaxis protein